jgi:asparagine synthase (glutamine-hydrolysing)
MEDALGRLHLVFNGEIYNHQSLRRDLQSAGHRFRSTSDTEVLLEAYARWGTNCLDHLDGMFAFALHDANRNQLFLARDRAGEKPLFYRHHGDRFSFASELKALLRDPALPRRADLKAVDHYLAYGYVPGDSCILEGFRKLRQGEALTYDLTTGDLSRWTYWRPPDPATGPPEARGDLVTELEELLRQAVRLRMEADVPVGILLSGGIDSSLVTALAAEVSSQPVCTFTVAFPGHGVFDEGPYARIVADHFGTDHHELVAEPASLDLLPLMARQFDEPMADSSMIPTFLVCQLIRQHATVAIGGDGGDELFGGYPHYSSLIGLESARRRLPAPVRRVARSLVPHMPLGLKGRNYLMALGANPSEDYAYFNMYFDAASRRRLMPVLNHRPPSSANTPEGYKGSLVDGAISGAARCMAVDFMTYLVDDILVKVDRASMLTSLEVRSPWLASSVIDFAFARVPTDDKVTATERKVLPRRLARRLLPPILDLDRKQGFSLPLQTWFEGEWGSYVESVLLDSDDGPFDRREMTRLLALQRRGFHNTHRLFALMLFELWRREYRVDVPE